MSEKTNEAKISRSFFQVASFGKRMEFSIIAQMLQEGLDIYRPMVDDKGIDCILRRNDGSTAEIQIKARSGDIPARNAGLFSAIECSPRPEYWYIFHAARVGKNGTMWIMNSLEFAEYASQNVNGKNMGKYSIQLHGARKDEGGELFAYPRKETERFIATDFSRIVDNQLFDLTSRSAEQTQQDGK